MTTEDPDDRVLPRKVSAQPREVEQGGQAWMSAAIAELARLLHPVLGLARQEIVSDVPRPADKDQDPDDDHASPLHRVIRAEHRLVVSIDEALAFDVESFLATLYEIADAYGSQLVSGMLQHISEVSEAAGQTVDARGKSIWDAILEAAESVEWSFDENGNHKMSTVVGPEMYQKMLEDPPSDEQKRKMSELIARKRREWDASQRRRDLP